MSQVHTLQKPRYSEAMVAPLRQEATSAGLVEWRTAQEVEAAILQPGCTFIFINSVCGCAARSARPALHLMVGNGVRPERMGTCFAGMDLEAVAKVREHITGFPPSSPSMVLFKDGKMVYFMPRHLIESSEPEEIAQVWQNVFAEHC